VIVARSQWGVVFGLPLASFACNWRPTRAEQNRDATPKQTDVRPMATAAPSVAAPSHKKGRFRIALVGDQGIGERAQSVLDLVRREAADALVVLGDFDYENRPQRWADMLGSLGAEFPWFAVVGNHDVQSWPAYEALIASKQGSIKDAHCHGKPGRQASCVFHDTQLVLSEIGTLGDRAENEMFIRQELAASRAKWKLCLWHKNQHDMQTGAKSDEVGWGAYQACQAAGAIIVTGHEHSYERTRTLTKVGDRASGHGASGPFNELEVGPGKTFVVVSGLGGIQTRPFVASHESDTWWAAYLTADRESVNGQVQPAKNADIVGALFLDLGIDGDADMGRGRFVTARHRVFDEFTFRLSR